MYARALEEIDVRIAGLRRAAWEAGALGCCCLAVAVAAASTTSPLAVPLFFGGLTGIFLGVRAEWQRWELIDRLLTERDAHVIEAVRARAVAEATLERRHSLAVSLRLILDAPGSRISTRLSGAVDDLEALARELDDEGLTIEPASAVACARLLTDPLASPLLNAAGRPTISARKSDRSAPASTGAARSPDCGKTASRLRADADGGRARARKTRTEQQGGST